MPYMAPCPRPSLERRVNGTGFQNLRNLHIQPSGIGNRECLGY